MLPNHSVKTNSFKLTIVTTAFFGIIICAACFFIGFQYGLEKQSEIESNTDMVKKNGSSDIWNFVYHKDGYNLYFPEIFLLRNNIIDGDGYNYRLYDRNEGKKMLEVHYEPGSGDKKYVEEIVAQNINCEASPVTAYPIADSNNTYYGFTTTGCYNAHPLTQGSGWLFNENCQTLDCELEVKRNHVYIPNSQGSVYHLEFDSDYPDIERTLRYFENVDDYRTVL